MSRPIYSGIKLIRKTDKQVVRGPAAAAAARGKMAESDEESPQFSRSCGSDEESSPPVSLAASTLEEEEEQSVASPEEDSPPALQNRGRSPLLNRGRPASSSSSPPVLKRVLSPETIEVEEDEDEEEGAAGGSPLRVRSVSASRGRSVPRAAALFSALTDGPSQSSLLSRVGDRVGAASRHLHSLRFGVGSVILCALALTLLLLAIGASVGVVRFVGVGSAFSGSAATSTSGATYPGASPSGTLHEMLKDLKYEPHSGSTSALLRQLRSALAEIQAAAKNKTSSPSM